MNTSARPGRPRRSVRTVLLLLLLAPFLSGCAGFQGVEAEEVYELTAPLDLTGLHLIADIDRPDLQYPRFVPTTHRYLAEVESAKPTDVFAAIRRRDILLHHPYDSFSTSVQTFLEQAAADPAGHYSRPDVTRLLLNKTPGDRVVPFSTPGVEIGGDLETPAAVRS